MRVWPLRSGSYRISDVFGSRGGTHLGMDFAADLGTPIYAAADGVVIEGADRAPGSVDGFGNWVWIEHAGNDTIYGHMRHADILVRGGDVVTAGRMIARVGNEGGSTGPHLHFEVWTLPGREGGSAINPQPWLSGAGQPDESTGGPPMSQFPVDLVQLTEADSGPRPTTQFLGVHTSEGALTVPSLLAFCANTANGASYNTMIGRDGQTGRSNDDDYAPWAAMPTGNSRGWHVCLLGFARQSREEWLSYGRQIDKLAEMLAFYCRKYDIPPVWLSAADLKAGRKGICGHAEISQAWRESDHTDPGPNFPKDVVIAKIAAILNNSGGPVELTPDQENREQLTGSPFPRQYPGWPARRYHEVQQTQPKFTAIDYLREADAKLCSKLALDNRPVDPSVKDDLFGHVLSMRAELLELRALVEKLVGGSK